MKCVAAQERIIFFEFELFRLGRIDGRKEYIACTSRCQADAGGAVAP